MRIVRNDNVKPVTFGSLRDFCCFSFGNNICIKIPEVVQNNTKFECICLSTNEFVKISEQASITPLDCELHVSRPVNVKEFIIEDGAWNI